MYLRPSEIFYSQDSINNVFDQRCNHRYKPIGETLDELCEGRCSTDSIPTISVIEKDGKWVTADNRRLWVFRQLERLGKCEKIHVEKGFYIPEAKLTSNNGGTSVQVRRSPGGYWHLKPSVIKPPANVKKINTPINKLYAGSNFPRNMITSPASIHSTNRQSSVYNNQFHREISSTSGNLYRQNTGVMNTSPIGTAYSPRQAEIYTPGVSSILQNPTPGFSNQLGRAANFNHGVFESYERNSGRGLKEPVSSLGETPSSGSANLTMPAASNGNYRTSGSDTKTNNRDVTNSRSAYMKRNDDHITINIPEGRVYSHKTYDASYARPRDNECCIII